MNNGKGFHQNSTDNIGGTKVDQDNVESIPLLAQLDFDGGDQVEDDTENDQIHVQKDNHSTLLHRSMGFQRNPK